MKQTAVEWLVEQLEKYYVFQDIKNTTAFLHAKTMEKEQIIQAHIDGQPFATTVSAKAEQYYNETFNTENE